jgi:hypothetical protein
VTFLFDDYRHVVEVFGVDGQMYMFPTIPIVQPHAERLLSETDAPPTACNWYELPTLTGAWTDRHDQLQTDLPEGRMACEFSLAVSMLFSLGRDASYPEDPAELDEFLDEECGGPIPAGRERARMRMTLVLRFTSLNEGTGRVFFDGHHNGRPFSGHAPITFSRN